MADELLSDADVFGGDEQLLSDADVFGAGRKGGTRSEAKPYVGLTEAENARRRFAETDPRRVDIAKSAGQMLEQPNAMDISGRLQAEREQLSQSPEAIERGRQQALYDARATRAPQEAKPLETTNRLTSDLRESTSNPALRGVVAGAAGLGKVGTGAVRLAADLAGAEDVSRFAAGAEGRASATERGATQDLKGNDKLVADVFASITNSAPSMALGVVGGPAMKALFAQSALSEYGAGRDAGFSVGESASRAGIMGAAEALGERFGFGEQVQLLKSVAKQLPTGELAKVFGAMLTKEIPGEQLTTAMQFMADKFGPAALNPKGSIDQYLEAAGETLKVTIGQSLLMGGGPATIGAVRNEYQRTDAQRGNPIADFLTPKPTAEQPALKPSEARSASIDRFGELAAGFGLPDKALAKAREVAATMPAGDVPAFLAKLADAYNKRGMFAKPLEPQAITDLQTAIDGPPKPAEPAADDAKNAAVSRIESVLKDAGALPGDMPDATGVLDEATAQPAPVEGEKINRNWSSFSPDSGTLNIPRSQMPQIAAEHRGALVNFLNARGVSHEMATVDPGELKPTQGEFEPKKVAAIAEKPSGRSLLVSADGHILDGHHQWLAARERGEPVRVVRLDADIQDLLRLAHQFPSSTTAKGPTRKTADDQSVVSVAPAVADGTADAGSAAGPRGSGDQRPDAAVDGRSDPAAAAPVPGGGTTGAVGDGGGPDAALISKRIADSTKPISAADAIALVEGKTEKPGGVNPSILFGAGAASKTQSYRIGDVPLDLFKDNEEGARYDGTVSLDRAKAYAERGVEGVPPVIASQGRVPGKLLIHDGGHRISAARLRGDKTIRAIVVVKDAAAPVSAQAPAQAGATEAAAPGVPGVRQLGSYGRTPTGATPIELRANTDGTLTPYTGKYPMVDYETGDPIVIPADASDAEAVDTIRAAKAIVAKDKFYGIKPSPSAAPAAETATPSTDAEPAESGAAPTEVTRDERIAAARTRIDGLKALLSCLGKA